MESLLRGGNCDSGATIVGGSVALAEIVGLNGSIVGADLLLSNMLDNLNLSPDPDWNLSMSHLPSQSHQDHQTP